LHSASSWLPNKTCAAEALDTGLGDGEEDTEVKAGDITIKDSVPGTEVKAKDEEKPLQ